MNETEQKEKCLKLINRIEARAFYENLYKKAIKSKGNWIIHPLYIYIFFISILLILLGISVIILEVISFIWYSHVDFSKYLNRQTYINGIVTFLLFIIPYIKVNSKKRCRSKEYFNYLYKVKKDRLLNENMINQLIADVDYLIEKEKTYVSNLTVRFKNFILVIYFPIVLFAIQNMMLKDVIQILLLLAYGIILAATIMNASDTFEVIQYFYIRDYYTYHHVKKELEYMKTIKIE